MNKPEKKKQTYSIAIDLIERMEKHKQKTKVSLSGFVEIAIEKELDRIEKTNAPND